ncbi:hypothetical protein XVE_0332 [Xanthomonas vesicatoria ATCC 35937]|uniref:Uncharacterized protein n=1 Tax=Xanthomonas vesicatoria ATCC 35937 TaxID=925775 RepID=F0B8D6_9XANT|nr:hypothetical protein XVE_0332 [Xanthomonas vesicatoria ATCC 35937]
MKKIDARKVRRRPIGVVRHALGDAQVRVHRDQTTQ